MMTVIVVDLENSLDPQCSYSDFTSRIGLDSEQFQSFRITWTAESLAKLSSLVEFDSSGSVGAPLGTSRSTAEWAVHTKMPMDSCCPIDDQRLNVPQSVTDSHQRATSQGYAEIEDNMSQSSRQPARGLGRMQCPYPRRCVCQRDLGQVVYRQGRYLT